MTRLASSRHLEAFRGRAQAGYAHTQGSALFPDEGSAWVQFAAGRTSNLCGIWKQVFAGQPERLRCLISPQTDWRELAETVLECPAWAQSHPGAGPRYEHVDAINVTGHFRDHPMYRAIADFASSNPQK